MNYNEILASARTQVGPYCKACQIFARRKVLKGERRFGCFFRLIKNVIFIYCPYILISNARVQSGALVRHYTKFGGVAFRKREVRGGINLEIADCGIHKP